MVWFPVSLSHMTWFRSLLWAALLGQLTVKYSGLLCPCTSHASVFFIFLISFWQSLEQMNHPNILMKADAKSWNKSVCNTKAKQTVIIVNERRKNNLLVCYFTLHEFSA